MKKNAERRVFGPANPIRIGKLITISILLLFVIPVTVEAQRSGPQDVRTEPVPPDPLYGMVRSDRVHVLIGENAMVSKDFLNKHTYNSGATLYGMNYMVPDFMYNGATRRIMSRSIQLLEIDDPADIRCGRAPGVYPNILDRFARLAKYQTTCIIGSSGWSDNGLTAYQTAFVFGTNSEDSGYPAYTCYSGATGVVGATPWGEPKKADQMYCHGLFTSNGKFVFGYGTDPKQRPDRTVEVKGNMAIEGGGLEIDRDLKVTGNVEVHGDLVIDGDIIITGDIRVKGKIYADDFVKNRK